jgi:hypothetical protein
LNSGPGAALDRGARAVDREARFADDPPRLPATREPGFSFSLRLESPFTAVVPPSIEASVSVMSAPDVVMRP